MSTDDAFVEILGPLTAASDLPNHPGMAPAYTSKALDEMIEQISETLRREQNNLVKMKNLLSTLRGDSQWAPCGAFHTDYDDMLLQGHWLGDHDQAQPSLAGDVRDYWNADTASAAHTATDGNTVNLDIDNDVEMANGTTQNGSGGTQEDTDTADAPMAGVEENVAGSEIPIKTASTADEGAGENVAQINGADEKRNEDSASMNENGVEGDNEDAASLPMSHRMTTRAQANKQSEHSSPMMSTSPRFNDDDVAAVHPIYTFPASAQPDADFGLPNVEAESLRGFLTPYVARKEEIVRCLTELQRGLLQADRMRKNVFKWTKAEGHVGEMSDGEDWYDMEEWGLKEPLKKGEEEPDEEANNPGKKTRQRRTEK